MAAPTLFAVLVIAVYPLVFIIILAFSESSMGRPFQEYVGVENLRTALQDRTVLFALARSIVFTFVTTVGAVAVGTGVAVLLHSARRRSRLIRTIVLLPMLTAPIAAGVMWRLLLNPSGPVNDILMGLGVRSEPIAFLGSSPWAFVSIMVADVWQWTPLVILLIFAELSTIPRSIHEAGSLDGASSWQRFLYLTLPMIMPGLLAATLLKIILGFRLFDLVYIVTRGGPGLDTTTSTYLIYRTALESFDIGSAAAQTLVFIVAVIIITLPVIALRARAERKIG